MPGPAWSAASPRRQAGMSWQPGTMPPFPPGRAACEGRLVGAAAETGCGRCLRHHRRRHRGCRRGCRRDSDRGWVEAVSISGPGDFGSCGSGAGEDELGEAGGGAEGEEGVLAAPGDVAQMRVGVAGGGVVADQGLGELGRLVEDDGFPLGEVALGRRGVDGGRGASCAAARLPRGTRRRWPSGRRACPRSVFAWRSSGG